MDQTPRQLFDSLTVDIVGAMSGFRQALAGYEQKVGELFNENQILTQKNVELEKEIEILKSEKSDLKKQVEILEYELKSLNEQIADQTRCATK